MPATRRLLRTVVVFWGLSITRKELLPLSARASPLADNSCRRPSTSQHPSMKQDLKDVIGGRGALITGSLCKLHYLHDLDMVSGAPPHTLYEATTSHSAWIDAETEETSVLLTFNCCHSLKKGTSFQISIWLPPWIRRGYWHY